MISFCVDSWCGHKGHLCSCDSVSQTVDISSKAFRLTAVLRGLRLIAPGLPDTQLIDMTKEKLLFTQMVQRHISTDVSGVSQRIVGAISLVLISCIFKGTWVFRILWHVDWEKVGWVKAFLTSLRWLCVSSCHARIEECRTCIQCKVWREGPELIWHQEKMSRCVAMWKRKPQGSETFDELSSIALCSRVHSITWLPGS